MYTKSQNQELTPAAKKTRAPFFQAKLKVNEPNDVYEQEADNMADKVMRMPAGAPCGNTFFKPAPSLIQRDDGPGKTLTGGASVVKDQLGEKPGYDKWQDEQTDALKKEIWDKQPTELKAGIIGFGLSSAGILGSVLATNPAFRADTLKLLDGKNIAAPLALIPHHDFFPLSSFKYQLPSATKAPVTFDTEFEFKPYLDIIQKKWSFLPKTDLTVGLSGAVPDKGKFGITGGSIKLKFGGGVVNLQGFVNQTLPVTPSLVGGNEPGESPMWLMRSLPGQADDKLPKGSGVFLTVDVLRIPDLLKGGDKQPDVQRKCADCEKEDTISRKEAEGSSAHEATSSVEKTLQSGGQPMDIETRGFMEQRFGHDFSNVQVHNDEQANRSSSDIDALAYTHSNHVVFGAGQYRPDTDQGKRLLAHELTHVVQQGGQPAGVQRHRVLDATESVPCLKKAEDTIQTLEKNMLGGSKYGQQVYIQEAIKILRNKMGASKIKCYAFDGIVHGVTDYGGDEIRLDGINLDWINETALLHEGVHAYHASQHGATARLYDAAQKSGRAIDGNNAADLKLLKWKAWTEYWAYRSNYEYYNPTRQQPMSDEDIDKSVMSNKDVRGPVSTVRGFDSSFDPKTYTP